MLLFLTVSAFAFDDVLPAVASSMDLEIEMPAVNIIATPDGATPWRRLSDGMAAEFALAKHGINISDASIVSVERGETHTRLDWTELESGQVRLRVDKPNASRICTASLSGRIWAGSGSVGVYAPTAGREEAVSQDLGFMIVDNHPTIGALVALSPGDSVTVTNVRKSGNLMREWVEVKRDSGSLTVDRKPGSERICTSGS